jgi:UDP-2,3-diacylglucosamine pyrophosphatase LpxH
MIPILRELWLDRLFLLVFTLGRRRPRALMLGGGRARWSRWVSSPRSSSLYELIVPKPDIRTYDSAPPTVKQLFDIHRAKAICMGHTHRPFSIWEEGPAGPRFHGNSGSWCPAFLDQLCTQKVLPARPLLLLSSEGDALWGGLHWWDGQTLSPEEGSVRAPPPTP